MEMRVVESFLKDASGNLKLFSMAFVELPRRYGGYEGVLCPFSIAFSMDRDQVPVSYANSAFTLVGGIELKQTMLAFVAVLNYLLRIGAISNTTFHRSIERSLQNRIANRLALAVEEFPQWARTVLKTSPYLDYAASDAACAELLAYVAPGSDKAAA